MRYRPLCHKNKLIHHLSLLCAQLAINTAYPGTNQRNAQNVKFSATSATAAIELEKYFNCISSKVRMYGGVVEMNMLIACNYMRLGERPFSPSIDSFGKHSNSTVHSFMPV